MAQRISGQADANGLPTQSSAAVTVAVHGSGLNGSIEHNMELAGPGDIASLQKDQIIRRDPPAGTSGFEPTNFPLIEFSSADLPWRYTPAKPNDDRLAPWLVLAVVEDSENVTIKSLGQGRYLMDIVENAGINLPVPEEAALWAHVQLDSAGQAELSRLICPIRLRRDTPYIAALVPLFEAGRRAALGIAQEDSQPILAWHENSNALTIPVFDHWKFSTGEEDFETLARRLFPAPPNPRVGLVGMDIGRPGHGLNTKKLDSKKPADKKIVCDFKGGLTAIGRAENPWPKAHQQKFQAELKTLLGQANRAPRQRNRSQTSKYDPLRDDRPLGPPVYGSWQNPKANLKKGWSTQINLDPALRVAAAMGARSFRRDQEKHMADAWRQLADLRTTTQKARRARLAIGVNGQIHHRISKLPVAQRLVLTQPAHKKMLKAGQLPKVKNLYRAPELPTAVLAPAFARMAKVTDRKLVTRSVSSAAAKPAASLSQKTPTMGSAINALLGQRLQSSRLAKKHVVAKKSVDYDIMLDGNPATASDAKSQKAKASGKSTSAKSKKGVGSKRSASSAGQALTLSRSNATAFNPRTVKAKALTKQPVVRNVAKKTKTKKPPTKKNALDMKKVATELDGALKPLQPIVQKFRSDARWVPPRSFVKIPVPATPRSRIRFDLAAVEEIATKAPGALVPGAEDIPLNGVAMVKSNPGFVGSFLIGINHEASREFAWRQLTTDLSQSWFRRFWDYVDDRDDIGAIGQWLPSSSLSKNMSNADADSVLLLKTELLKRHPETIIYAAPAIWDNSSKTHLIDAKNLALAVTPMFDGTLGRSMKYVGFDMKPKTMVGSRKTSDAGWFVVFEQPLFAPRFGIDHNMGRFHPNKAPTKSDNLHWGHFAPNSEELQGLPHVPVDPAWSKTAIDGFLWGRSSTDMAALTWQRPVRVLMHAEKLVQL